MSDLSVRELEREVARTGTVEARLALAHALERAGREVEGYDALLPVAREPAARAWLSRFPTWWACDGDAGGTNYLDVPPIRSPRSRRAERDFTRTIDGLPRLSVATASGGLALWNAPEGAVNTELLDGRDASPRCTLPERVEWAHGEHLFARCSTQSLQAWTHDGEAVTGLPRGRLQAVTAGGDLLVTDDPFWDGDGPQRLRSIRLLPAEEDFAVLWTIELRGRYGGTTGLVVAGNQILSPLVADQLQSIDRETGAVRWTWPAVRTFAIKLDTAGFVALLSRRFQGGASYDSQLACFDPAGQQVWASQGVLTPKALGPEVVVVGELTARRERLWILERTTGRRIAHVVDWPAGRLEDPSAAVYSRPVILVRDVLITTTVQDGAALVVAVRASDGERLWAIGMGASPIVSLVPGPGRLWILDQGGKLGLLRGSP